jgi:hypothetical protein
MKDYDFKAGDKVKLAHSGELEYSILEVGIHHGWFVGAQAKIWPIDLYSALPRSIVLTKAGKHIPDPTAWLKQFNNAAWARGSHGDFLFHEVLNEYTKEHGGATSFDWNRPKTVPVSSLILV